MASTIMAIAAHPGDAIFTMGATVAQHVQGGGAGVFVSLTLGEKGAPKEIPVERYAEMQREASNRAAKILGAQFELLTYPDAEIPLRDQIALEICDLIRKHKPAIVITHWSGSWHKDHQNCHLLVRDAIFYAALRAMSRKDPPHFAGRVYYADNWEDEENFKPDTYLDVTAVFDKFLQASAVYPMWRGETGFRYNDYYASLAVMRGCRSGFERAVALMSDPNESVRRVKTLG